MLSKNINKATWGQLLQPITTKITTHFLVQITTIHEIESSDMMCNRCASVSSITWWSGRVEALTVAWALTFAALCTKILTISSCPASDAMCRAVFPFCSETTTNLHDFTGDALKIKDTDMLWFCWGEGQTFVAASTSAWRLMSSVTTLMWPSLEARWSAFSPFCRQTQKQAASVKWHTVRQLLVSMTSKLTALLVFMSMLSRKYVSTFSKFPARAARKKLELPSDYRKTKQVTSDWTKHRSVKKRDPIKTISIVQ